jgi:hypothetical protein
MVKLYSISRLKGFSNAQSSALGHGLRNIRRDSWAKAFKGYAKRLALAITSEGNFNGYRFCKCFYKRLCGLADFCPRCGKIIQKELKAQFGKSFGRAPHWMTFTLSFDSASSRAGLRYTTQKDQFGRVLRAPKLLNPYQNQPDRPTLGADVENQADLKLLAKTALDFISALEADGEIKGALASRELAVEFFPLSQPDPFTKGRVGHAGYVNVHVTACMDQPLTRDLARKFFDRFCSDCESSGAAELGYPNMLVSKLEDQKELNRWLAYSNKTIPVEDYYEKAIEDGCDIQSLNTSFDDVLWCIKKVFEGVRNRRRIGVMRLKSPNDKQYIGRLTKTQLERRSRNSEFKKFMKQTAHL